MTQLRLPSILLSGIAGAALVACGAKSSDADGTAELPDRELCPDCTPDSEAAELIVDQLGCCTTTRTSVDADDPRALSLGVERDIRLIEAGYQGPFQWRRSWGSTQAKGFEAETGLQLAASVQSIEYVDEEPSPDPGNPLLCPHLSCDDYLDLRIHVEMATDDGAIRGGGDLLATAQYSPLSVRSAALPIAAFSGKLDLGITEVQPHSGGVLTGLEFSESGVQGWLFPWIGSAPRYPDSELPYRDSGPVMGQWPVPTCAGRGLPIDIDLPLETWPRGTVRDLFGAVSAQLELASPLPAAWSDGSSTDVSVRVAGEIEHACTKANPTSVRVLVPLQLETSDGRIDQVLPAEFGMLWDDGDAVPVWSWQIQTEVLDVASIQRIAGPIGTKEKEARIEASGQLQQGSWSVTGKSGSVLGRKLQW